MVLDINMPDRSGIDILQHIRSGRNLNVRILVLSGFAEKQYAINMLRAGASGYLAKDQAPRGIHARRSHDTGTTCQRQCGLE